ncbi:BTB/POZ domain-containing protein [Phanerochaete sordida]|uniref:BTB/POZ domain-containing protein n=1 Tax=Phanerochaete sordida TaxID=48140 RepID=A0A9P3LBY3_9APHY|nr:BTB/POZ domain-containing protein [Phanerochaete sordida]
MLSALAATSSDDAVVSSAASRAVQISAARLVTLSPSTRWHILASMPASTRGRSRTDDSDAPKKRQKIEPQEREGVPSVQIPKRAKEFWFDEGNVILAAKNRSFKVHTSVLMLRSEVLKKMLNGPALSRVSEKLDGCAVVRLDDDDRDIEGLLQIIYQGGNSPWFDSQKPPILYVEFRAIVRIAVKYEVKDVVKEAKHRLSRVFPTDSLDNWDEYLQPDGKRTSITLVDTDCIDVLNLARLLNMRAILPLVFYACANMGDIAVLTQGWTFDEEDVRLSNDDLTLCLDGRDALTEESTKILRPLLELAVASSQRPPDCSTPSRCRLAFEFLTLAAMDAGYLRDASALGGLNDWLDEQGVKPNSKPCKHCDKALKKAIDERREETWRTLGTIFDIPEWPAGQQQNNNAPVAAPAASAAAAV